MSYALEKNITVIIKYVFSKLMCIKHVQIYLTEIHVISAKRVTRRCDWRRFKLYNTFEYKKNQLEVLYNKLIRATPWRTEFSSEKSADKWFELDNAKVLWKLVNYADVVI